MVLNAEPKGGNHFRDVFVRSGSLIAEGYGFANFAAINRCSQTRQQEGDALVYEALAGAASLLRW